MLTLISGSCYTDLLAVVSLRFNEYEVLNLQMDIFHVRSQMVRISTLARSSRHAKAQEKCCTVAR